MFDVRIFAFRPRPFRRWFVTGARPRPSGPWRPIDRPPRDAPERRRRG